jgi:site-specific recombinase XerD
MNRRDTHPLLTLVESFFCDYLQRVRGASQHTCRAYRDTLRLLLIYLADQKKCAVDTLKLDDLQVEAISAFLVHLESHRTNTAVTRNCRLAAIRAFFRHLIRHDPSRAGQYSRVLSLPSKKVKRTPAAYLEPEDVRIVLEQPDQTTPSGQRDHALLLFLYNTGARVSEILSVRVADLDFTSPPQVRLQGKGRKERFCPLWRETTNVLQRLPAVRDNRPGDPLFLSQKGSPLSRDGVAYILRKHATAAERTAPALCRQPVTPHLLRHSCAVALLQAGVDITVIRDYLGHTSVAITSRYITTNLNIRREALEAFWQRSGISPTHPTPWEPKPALLAFLASL